ncbi:MAG: DUF2461 domain-containing protein [Chitinophagaceae bacterium]
MIEPQTLKFISTLKKNNNREWFEKHRPQYEAARIDFQNFVQLVIDGFGKSDLSIAGLTARDCLFRLNRDVRFSKDKSPYKTNMGATIKREGKKSVYASYYFHLEPGASFVGGGLWMPEADSVKKVRQEIDYNWEEFNSIVTASNFKSVFGDLYKGGEVSLVNQPKGYEKENPAIDYLKLKSFIAEQKLPDEALTKATLHKKTIIAFETLQPLICFINRSLQE